MDTSNWRHTHGGSSGAVGDTCMESGDWRFHLQADSRQRILNRIMDTLKSNIRVYGDGGLQELVKIAVNFEEKVYIDATSQSEYMRKICFKILTIETRSQNPMLDTNSVNPSDPDLNGEDWQEELYEKIKAMKDLYLLDLNELNLKILRKLQQQNSLPQQPENAQLEKLKVFKNMLERLMAFLHTPKHNILHFHGDKLNTYEELIIRIINSTRRKPAPN